jgi:hypothetical protein
MFWCNCSGRLDPIKTEETPDRREAQARATSAIDIPDLLLLSPTAVSISSGGKIGSR